ncbi:MAG: hypothetical protein WCC58_07525 [Burkholderiales bacterium]
MQVIDYIETYAIITLSFTALIVIAESVLTPLMDIIQRMKPAAANTELATVHVMPPRAARKHYKEWDNMQLDAAA